MADRRTEEAVTRHLWGLADRARGAMTPAEFRSAVLGLIFLEWLSRPELGRGDYAVPPELRPRIEQTGRVRSTSSSSPSGERTQMQDWIPQVFGRLDYQSPVLFELQHAVENLMTTTTPAAAFETMLEFSALREGPRGGESSRQRRCERF